jgi:hypothetical protein
MPTNVAQVTDPTFPLRTALLLNIFGFVGFLLHHIDSPLSVFLN